MSEDSKVTGIKRMAQLLNLYLDRSLGGIALLAVHEMDSLRGHLSALRERWSVARRARTPGELIRDQVDLLPESRNRVLQDQDVRKELWRGLVKDLSARAQKLG